MKQFSNFDFDYNWNESFEWLRASVLIYFIELIVSQNRSELFSICIQKLSHARDPSKIYQFNGRGGELFTDSKWFCILYEWEFG